MNAEDFFIGSIGKANRFIGDDGAVVEGAVYSKDLFCEGVHFRCEWLSMYEIARKAMLVNISDAVAMNAVPKYALIGLGMPANITHEQMRELSRGFQESARAYGMTILGGDTIAAPQLQISITIVSKTQHPLLRKGVRKGDMLAYTGSLGGSLKALRYLMRGGRRNAKSRFSAPVLRSGFIYKNRSLLAAGMDISDGLFSDLGKLLGSNTLGLRFFSPIPKSVGCSGEEYEMLIAFDPRRRRAIIRRAAQSRVKLTIFARATRGRFRNRCKAHHF